MILRLIAHLFVLERCTLKIMKRTRFLSNSALLAVGLLVFSGCSNVVTSTQSPSEACAVFSEEMDSLGPQITGLGSDLSAWDEVVKGLDSITAEITNEEMSAATKELSASLEELVSLGRLINEQPDLSRGEIESLRTKLDASQNQLAAAYDEINRLCISTE